ncbi:tubulin polymerization-promoting protein homolog [Amyelois transitella]|uniref:tubulin polymerization-promoting protein homolog n=1 Tax=Amyelois transitella TaxID=680683 RepID=UPI00298FD1E3|nr:tubulin polymerization-promoting protein homolog [Amyelois transitella]
MGDEEQATLDGQFVDFAKMLEPKLRSGETINLYRMDYWLRQAKVLDDRKITMTDTGIIFNKFCKTEIKFDEFLEVLEELSITKCLNLEHLHEALTNCGLPGQTPVEVPQYSSYFRTYKPKEKMVLS